MNKKTAVVLLLVFALMLSACGTYSDTSDYSDGYIFRMQNNPDPIPIGENALGYNQFIAQTWDTFLTDYPDNVTKSVVKKARPRKKSQPNTIFFPMCSARAMLHPIRKQYSCLPDAMAMSMKGSGVCIV